MRLLLAFLVTFGLAAVNPDGERAVVQRVSITPSAQTGVYVVRLHAGSYVNAYSSARSIGANDFEITLFNTDVASSLRSDETVGPLSSYDFEMRDGHLVFKMHMVSTAAVDVSVYRDAASNDLLVGLAERAGNTTDNGGIVTPSPVARERWRLDTVVIDAGHGGKDPGAVANGVREKDVTLAVALKLGAYLKERLGVNVVYTRDTDRFIELQQRGHIANEQGGKLFISLHANSARARSAAGAETFFLGMHKTPAAKKVLERENSVVMMEDNPDVYKGYDNLGIAHVLAQSAYMRQSESLAETVQNEFEATLGRKNRGVRQAGFYVLWSASMPAILVEMGFLTNRSDAAFLKSSRGQDYLASAIYRSVRKFKSEYEKALELTKVE